MSCANKQPISAINANAFEAPFIGGIGAIASRSSLRDLLAGKWLYIFGDSSGRGLYLALYQQLVADAASYDNDSTLLVLPGQADPGISAVSQLVRPQTFGRHASTRLSIVSRSARLARRRHCHHRQICNHPHLPHRRRVRVAVRTWPNSSSAPQVGWIE